MWLGYQLFIQHNEACIHSVHREHFQKSLWLTCKHVLTQMFPSVDEHTAPDAPKHKQHISTICWPYLCRLLKSALVSLYIVGQLGWKQIHYLFRKEQNMFWILH